MRVPFRETFACLAHARGETPLRLLFSIMCAFGRMRYFFVGKRQLSKL